MKDLFTELQLPVKGPKLIDMSTFFDDVEKLNIDPSEIIDLDFDKPDPKKDLSREWIQYYDEKVIGKKTYYELKKFNEPEREFTVITVCIFKEYNNWVDEETGEIQYDLKEQLGEDRIIRKNTEEAQVNYLSLIKSGYVPNLLSIRVVIVGPSNNENFLTNNANFTNN